MYEVTIPLRPVKDNELGAPEDYFRIIREEYASRYLEMLNIASTPANKADFMRYRMMDDCDMMGIWPDLRTSVLADAVRIVPPLRQRIGDLADMDEIDKRKMRQWYGQADPILVRQPGLEGVSFGIMKLDADDEEGNCAAVGSGAVPEATKAEIATQQITKGEPGLVSEFEQFRIGGAEKFAEVGKGLRTASSRNDAERRERQKEELVSLKAKFILPFACERPAKEGGLSGPSRDSEIMVWPMNGPLLIDAPQEMWEEVLQPIRIPLEDVQKNTSKWVEENAPLEYLTSRKDEKLWAEVKATLQHSDVARLIGLLAHLLHWVALMPLRKEGPHLSESALQSLFVAIHESWSQFEKKYRDSKTGVSFVLPCLMLTIKRGIERCFESSYSMLMSDEMLQQQVIDRINTLLMRLFDPDGMYARFGKFDGEGKAIWLSKKLDVMMASQGSNHVKRLHGRMHRATPLVRAVLGLTGTEGCRGTVTDTKTRRMMLHSDHGGVGASGSVVNYPQDKDRHSALLKAAIDRLPPHSKHSGSGDSSPRQPLSARQHQQKRETNLLAPQSARAGGSIAATSAAGTPSGASFPKDSPIGAGRPAPAPSGTPSGSSVLKDSPVGGGRPAPPFGTDSLLLQKEKFHAPAVREQTRLPALSRHPRKVAV